MNRLEFILGLSAMTKIESLFKMGSSTESPISVHLLRHASLIVGINGLTLLVDPMLAQKDAMAPVTNAVNSYRIPMRSLPVSNQALAALLRKVDAVLVTHLHRDHWDLAAQILVPKNKPVFCLPGDQDTIIGQGFSVVRAVEGQINFCGVTIERTGGQHGTGEIGKMMGPVSGFVLRSQRRSIYIAGDTIWCEPVRLALETHKPDVVVVNAGGAQFLSGDPITMTPPDIVEVCQALPTAKVVAVHMDTVNHCLVTRKDLRAALTGHNLARQVIIPDDGEVINFEAP